MEQDIKILEMIVTNKCNLDCSFCGGDYYMSSSEDVGKKALLESTLAAVKDNEQLDEMLWLGGEPLLAMSKIEGIFPAVKALRPELRHDFMTNGLRLRLEHVELLSQFQRVTVSIDGFRQSERPLMGFIEGGHHEAFEALAKLPNKRTWAVITRDQLNNPRWHEDILELHKAIYHLGWESMSLTFDTGMTKPLSPDHILNFTWGYKRLLEQVRALNHQNGKNTAMIVEKFFDHEKCTKCSQTLLLKADGEGSPFEDINHGRELVTGCNKMASILGHDAYQYLHKFLNPKPRG